LGATQRYIVPITTAVLHIVRSENLEEAKLRDP